MTKVMVSFPDDVLRAIDVEAERRGTSRSGLLRTLAEESMRSGVARRIQRMKRLDDAAGRVARRGGGVSEVVKANRPAR
ncbi:MAG: ribbon-helix-helix protein, CopG family [Schumannella sp.]|nr:ribbon-helix-helix protein, CopG family [Microbacteriaceae bacterium]